MYMGLALSRGHLSPEATLVNHAKLVLTAAALVASRSLLKLAIFIYSLLTQSDPSGSLSTVPFNPPAIPVPATASVILEAHLLASPGGSSRTWPNLSSPAFTAEYSLTLDLAVLWYA